MDPLHRPLQPLKRLLSETRAATAVEYGLIAAVIVVVMIVSLKGVAAETVSMWSNVADVVVRTGVR